MKNITGGLMNRPRGHYNKLRSICMDCYKNTPKKRETLDKDKEGREKRLNRASELQKQDLEKINRGKDPSVPAP